MSEKAICTGMCPWRGDTAEFVFAREDGSTLILELPISSVITLNTFTGAALYERALPDYGRDQAVRGWEFDVISGSRSNPEGFQAPREG